MRLRIFVRIVYNIGDFALKKTFDNIIDVTITAYIWTDNALLLCSHR